MADKKNKGKQVFFSFSRKKISSKNKNIDFVVVRAVAIDVTNTW